MGFYYCPNLQNLSKTELSSKDLRVIKGESKWWETLKWNKAEWGDAGRPNFLNRIFSPITVEADMMAQLAADHDVDEDQLQRERERDFRLLQGPRPPRILSGPSSSDKDPLRSGNVHASIERPRLSGKKVVLKVELYDDKIKEKAMKAVSRLSGVESVSADREGHKMTIIGDVDPVSVVGKLRKLCRAEILSVGPAKEVKKEEAKKPEGKKKDPKEEYGEILEAYEGYYSQTRQPSPCYYYRPMEEDPKRCVIC